MNTLLSDSMTLDEKLAAIDEMMANTEAKEQKGMDVPDDPITSLLCGDACQ